MLSPRRIAEVAKLRDDVATLRPALHDAEMALSIAKAEIIRLTALVESAYREGWAEGHSQPGGTIDDAQADWLESNARAALEQQ